MAKKTESVEPFMEALEHPRKAEIAAVRAAILGADPAITERIKWNAPSFCYDGDDRVTFRLHPPEKTQLIFHRGAKVKDATGFAFEDETGLIAWAAPDRGIVAIADVVGRLPVLVDLVTRWMKATSAPVTP